MSEIPDAVLEPPRRRIQLVWIIPIVAAVIGAYIAITTILAQGPTVTISFRTAEGLEAGKTKIRYKDVEIGLITHVALERDASGVIAEAQFAKEASDLLVEDTRFWVVKPRVSSSSVTGLGTLFSGSYLGVDVGKSNKARRSVRRARSAADRHGRRARHALCDCAATKSVRSASARRSITVVSKSGRSCRSRSTRTAAAFRCRCS